MTSDQIKNATYVELKEFAKLHKIKSVGVKKEELREKCLATFGGDVGVSEPVEEKSVPAKSKKPLGFF